MKLSPTTWLLGAGVLAGGVLLYLTKKSAAATSTPAQPQPQQIPPGAATPMPPASPAQAAAAVAQAAVQQVADLGNPLHLLQGTYFRGRLELSGNTPPFDVNASEESIGKGLSALGFQDVRVYQASELPADWPAVTAQALLPTTRFFQGMWGAATSDMARQPQLVLMWVTPSPPTAVQPAAVAAQS